jgi:hypothetical protein
VAVKKEMKSIDVEYLLVGEKLGDSSRKMNRSSAVYIQLPMRNKYIMRRSSAFAINDQLLPRFVAKD